MQKFTIKKYLIDPELSGIITITEIIHGPKPIVRTQETFFHPQGGGQKADLGRIGAANVIHVVHNNGEVDHYVDSIDNLEVGLSYDFMVDSKNRKLNSTYHTVGHLLASLIDSMNIGLQAVSGHQWPNEARIEFLVTDQYKGQLTVDNLNTDLKNYCNVDLSIKIMGSPFNNREIQIGEFKPIPCGGTHLKNLLDLRSIEVTNIKIKSGRLRISYEADAN